jgi:tetratricopeptide (TPR) repeat protein
LLDAERQIGDSAELRLTRLKLLLLRHDNQAAPFLSGLAEGLERFAKEDQARLLGELADAYVACGQVAEGVRLWKRVEVLQPDNLSVRIQLFNLAMQGGDEPGAEELEQAIRRIDRSGIYGNFCAACRCIQQAQAGEHEALVTARDQLVAIARQRPEWPHVQVCLARVAEMENNGESAIEYYRRALELGEHRPGVVRQLIELLFQRQRYAEAEDAINKLQERAPISSAVQKLAAEIALRGSNPDRALAWANKAVPANVKDYRDQIWLGQFLWAAGRKTEAEAALRRALALAEGNPDPWVALVQYQVRIGQLREAQATIQKAEARLPRDAGSLALAQCYEAVKRPDRAEECYRAAATAKPGDFGVLRMVADFYLRSNQFSKAEPCLRKFLDPQQHPPDSAARWARRMLAVRLAVAGTFPQFQEALGLLERNLDNKESVEDQLAKATVLATRPVYRRDAIALLESAFKQKPPAPDEEFLLAQLYDIYDHKLKAQEIMVRLLGAHPDNPVYLARFLGSQIRQSRFEECETWMKKLRALQPHAFATVELEARLLSLRGEGQGVIPLIKTYLENKNSDPGDVTARRQLAAELLEQLGQEFVELRKLYDPLTEDLYRKVAAKSGRPDAILALARCFARQHRLADALGLCERAWQSSSPETAAQISVAVLTSAAANESQLGRVEKWLAPAVAKKPRAVALLGAMAILRERQGRYADAEALYRQMIAEDSHAGAAFNNLAYLLSFQKGRGEEALDLIDRAMELQGPNPDCLDTRAVIYLALGREDKAIADLNEALADGSNATWYYHLAIAYIAAKNSSAATNALSQAKKLGLEVNMLHPLERSTCQTILDSVNRG